MLDEKLIQELRKDMQELKTVFAEFPPRKFLELNQAAEYLSLSKSAMQKISAKRIIPVYKPTNGKVYFLIRDLNDFIDRGILVPTN
jgi:predicted HTH domain antitoxin